MSTRPTPTSDDEVVDLSFQLEGLSISVRGSPAAALDFVRRASTGGTSDPAQSLSAGVVAAPPSSSFSRVTSVAASSVGRSSAGQSDETRGSVEGTFPPCPAHYLLLASSSGERTSRLSPEDRIKRAWKAGCWAGAVLEGRVQSPNKTPTIDLGNRIYVVIRGPGITAPRCFNSSAAFFAAIGDLSRSDSICHGFPSKVEARVYLAGAGQTLEELDQ